MGQAGKGPRGYHGMAHPKPKLNYTSEIILGFGGEAPPWPGEEGDSHWITGHPSWKGPTKTIKVHKAPPKPYVWEQHPNVPWPLAAQGCAYHPLVEPTKGPQPPLTFCSKHTASACTHEQGSTAGTLRVDEQNPGKAICHLCKLGTKCWRTSAAVFWMGYGFSGRKSICSSTRWDHSAITLVSACWM